MNTAQRSVIASALADPATRLVLREARPTSRAPQILQRTPSFTGRYHRRSVRATMGSSPAGNLGILTSRRRVITRWNRRSPLVHTAFHEAGHAVIAGQHGTLVTEVTITPTDQSLGSMLHNPGDLASLPDPEFNDRIRDFMVVLLAGQEAERIFDITNLPDPMASDVKRAEDIADYLLLDGAGDEYPMTDTDLLEARTAYLYRQRVQSRIWLRSHWTAVETVAKALLRHKTLTTEQLREIAPHYVAPSMDETRE